MEKADAQVRAGLYPGDAQGKKRPECFKRTGRSKQVLKDGISPFSEGAVLHLRRALHGADFGVTAQVSSRL
jgi:hypothetical protein